jgi:F-type H+-transporting ATPase subunit b
MKRFEATMRMHRSIAAALAAVAAFPAVLWAAEEGQPGLFSVNLGLSVWTIVIFLSLLFILRKYAWGPILSGLEAREEGIQGKLDKAAEEREEASRLLEEHRSQLADTRREAQQLIAEARAAGERVRKDLEEKARGEAQGIVEAARRDIERERDEALDTIRKQSVELALAAAEKLIQERLSADRDRELVESFLSDMTSENREA